MGQFNVLGLYVMKFAKKIPGAAGLVKRLR